MDKRVAIQANEPTRDAIGAEVPNWVTKWRRWVEIKPLSGTEKFDNQQWSGEATHEMRGWWVPGITPLHRVQYGSRTFDILAALNLYEAGVEMRLICKERTA